MSQNIKVLKNGSYNAVQNNNNVVEETVNVDYIVIYIKKYYKWKKCSILEYMKHVDQTVYSKKTNINKWYITIQYSKTTGLYGNHYCSLNRTSVDKNVFIDTFFHNQKNEIIENLTKVDSNKDFFHQMGQIPRAGYCLYGPPGSGKTNFVYRMARYLNRHIINIDIKKITKNELINYFNDFYDSRNGKYLCPNDIIYFFDEFDEVILELKKRQMYIDSYYKSIKSGDAKNEYIDDMIDLVTFNDLLELFSGICPLEGVIIIVATNKFEMISKIIPELFRDGRLTPMYFGYFDGKLIKEICNKYYGKSPDIDDNLKPNITNSQLMETILNTHKLDSGYERFITKYSKKLRLNGELPEEETKEEIKEEDELIFEEQCYQNSDTLETHPRNNKTRNKINSKLRNRFPQRNNFTTNISEDNFFESLNEPILLRKTEPSFERKSGFEESHTMMPQHIDKRRLDIEKEMELRRCVDDRKIIADLKLYDLSKNLL